MIQQNQMPPELTEQDANALIGLVQSAPLQNLNHARAVDQLCVRAQAHFAIHFGLKAAERQIAEGAKPSAKGGKKAKETAPSGDAASDPAT